ncbi:PHP-associated domain-containing protein [Halobacteriaceae archaeon GCM10025711]
MHVKVLDERVVERAKARNIDALVYAPHFTRLPAIRERAARFSDDDLLVVPAREVFTGSWRDRKHVLAVGLDDPVPDFVSLDGAMREFARQDAAVLVPHPEFLTVSLESDDVAAYRDQIHAVETYNPKHLRRHNRRARAVAREHDLPAFTSSYAHLRGTVGEAWTEFESPVADEAGLVDALKRGEPRSVMRRNGVSHEARCKVEFAHLGWENTYHKVDRVLLSGMEPTHPGHIAYDGRFDDVRVY